MNYLNFEDLTICAICNSKLFDEGDQLVCDDGHWALEIGDHYYAINNNEKHFIFKNKLGIFSLKKDKTAIFLDVSVFNSDWECMGYIESKIDEGHANKIIHACKTNDFKYLTKLIILF